MQHDYDALRERLYRAFDKITQNATLLAPDAKTLTAEEASAAAQLAQAILAVDTAAAVKVTVQAPANTDTPATMGVQRLVAGAIPTPDR